MFKNLKYSKILNLNFAKNFCSCQIPRITNTIPKVSLVQRPGDSFKRHVTLIPGEGIGREIASIF